MSSDIPDGRRARSRTNVDEPVEDIDKPVEEDNQKIKKESDDADVNNEVDGVEGAAHDDDDDYDYDDDEVYDEYDDYDDDYDEEETEEEEFQEDGAFASSDSTNDTHQANFPDNTDPRNGPILNALQRFFANIKRVTNKTRLLTLTADGKLELRNSVIDRGRIVVNQRRIKSVSEREPMIKPVVDTNSQATGAYKCQKCYRQFNSRIQLLRHLFTHQREILTRDSLYYQCSICSKKFLRYQNMGLHLNMHTRHLKYYCRLCGSRCLSDSSLYLHIKVFHRSAGSRYRCPFTTCRETFPSSYLKFIHISTHNRQSYKCQFCDKTFTLQGCLKLHEKKHIDTPIALTQNSGGNAVLENSVEVVVERDGSAIDVNQVEMKNETICDDIVTGSLRFGIHKDIPNDSNTQDGAIETDIDKPDVSAKEQFEDTNNDLKNTHKTTATTEEVPSDLQTDNSGREIDKDKSDIRKENHTDNTNNDVKTLNINTENLANAAHTNQAANEIKTVTQDKSKAKTKVDDKRSKKDYTENKTFKQPSMKSTKQKERVCSIDTREVNTKIRRYYLCRSCMFPFITRDQRRSHENGGCPWYYYLPHWSHSDSRRKHDKIRAQKRCSNSSKDISSKDSPPVKKKHKLEQQTSRAKRRKSLCFVDVVIETETQSDTADTEKGESKLLVDPIQEANNKLQTADNATDGVMAETDETIDEPFAVSRSFDKDSEKLSTNALNKTNLNRKDQDKMVSQKD